MPIEGDSKIIIETAKDNMPEGLAIKWVIDDITYLLTILNRFYLNHIFQKGNSVTNGMAAINLKLRGLRCWRNLNALLNLVRELVSHKVKNDES